MTVSRDQILDAATLRTLGERMQQRGEDGTAAMAFQMARWIEAGIDVPEDLVREQQAVTLPPEDTIEPGIRAIVRRLHAAGFETTDSGDGVSQSPEAYASGAAMPFPHVAVASSPAGMVWDAHAVAQLLGDLWHVEATYDARKGCAYLFARPLFARERQA